MVNDVTGELIGKGVVSQVLPQRCGFWFDKTVIFLSVTTLKIPLENP
jgi:hypothetical protein